jgi:hypothetical protein
LRARVRGQLAHAIADGIRAALGSGPLGAEWYDAASDHPEDVEEAARKGNADRAEAEWLRSMTHPRRPNRR